MEASLAISSNHDIEGDLPPVLCGLQNIFHAHTHPESTPKYLLNDEMTQENHSSLLEAGHTTYERSACAPA